MHHPLLIKTFHLQDKVSLHLWNIAGLFSLITTCSTIHYFLLVKQLWFFFYNSTVVQLLLHCTIEERFFSTLWTFCIISMEYQVARCVHSVQESCGDQGQSEVCVSNSWPTQASSSRSGRGSNSHSGGPAADRWVSWCLCPRLQQLSRWVLEVYVVFMCQ